MSYSQFLWGKLLESVAHGVPYAAPATWVALVDEGGAELANADYARQLVDVPAGASPKWSGALTNASGGRVENVGAIVFTASATVDWGTVKGVVVFDADTGGNELMRELLPQPRTVLVGDPFRIPAQALKIRLVAA